MTKYQVFVSSTYQDLIEERKEVIQALLELDCIPVGMELFPATDDTQWTLIKELIEDCDYYILIIGGRYGSLNNDGISYTQMEYEYAVKIGVPTISFLHKTPDKIPVGKTDKDKEKEEKLAEFRKLVSEKIIKFWSSPEELGSVVSRSLVKLIKTKPRTGWVKADRISTNEANLEILELKQRILELEEQFSLESNKSFEHLSQGDDEFEIGYTLTKYKGAKFSKEKVIVSWNRIFSKTCPMLIHEAKEEDYQSHINDYIKFIVNEAHDSTCQIYIITDYFRSIIIQFKALGLIEQSNKKRSLKDTSTYWKLTNKGDKLLTELRAIKRNENND